MIKRSLKQYRSETKKLRESKRNLEIYFANSSKTNTKEFYDYVRKRKILSKSISSPATGNGQHSDDKNLISSILNGYYAQEFTLEDTPKHLQLFPLRTKPISSIASFLWEMTNCTR